VTKLGAAAIGYAERNLLVFPLRERDKIPATTHGCKDATKDLDQIRKWWKANREANIAIATGARSDLWVLDVDPDKGGRDTLLKIEQKFSATLPATVKVVTGSGGEHRYFKWPHFKDAPDIRNSAGVIGPGLDVRGSGGYVAAPPSVHPNGRAYGWALDCGTEIVEAPVWFLQHVTGPKAGNSNITPINLHKVIRDGVVEGSRNDRAARLCGHLLRLGADPTIVLDLMLGWNQGRNRPPLADGEITAIVSSIAKRESSRRTKK
jgi:putative DNA primase/helicase